MERREPFFINLNRIYQNEAPNFDNLDEYKRRVTLTLPNETKDLHVVFTGTAPVWLLTRMGTFLSPFVWAISWRSIEKGEITIEYLLYCEDPKIQDEAKPRIIK